MNLTSKNLTSLQNSLRYYILYSIESNQLTIENYKKWITKVQENPRKAIRKLKRKTVNKYKILEKNISEELKIFEATGIVGEKLKQFQDEKIESAKKSILTTRKRLNRDRRRLKMVNNNLSGLLIELHREETLNKFKDEIALYERKFKLRKLNKNNQ
jgi:hypothetical protein